MNTTKVTQELKMAERGTDKQGRDVRPMEKDLNTTTSALIVGFLFVLAPLLALFLFFLPMSGAGYFGSHRGPAFTVYLLLVNLPFGTVTALAARAIIGKHP